MIFQQPKLPPHRHTTNGLPTHLMPALFNAYEMAILKFSNLVETPSPDLIIYDTQRHWVPKVASSYNIPAVFIVILGATSTSFCLHILKKRVGEFPSPAIRLTGFLDKQIRKMLEPKDRVKDREEDDGKIVNNQSRVFTLVNTFTELEGKYIDYMSILTGKKAVPVGPLTQDIVDDDENEHGEIMQWLDQKDEKSTVFVSFGGEFLCPMIR